MDKLQSTMNDILSKHCITDVLEEISDWANVKSKTSKDEYDIELMKIINTAMIKAIYDIEFSPLPPYKIETERK